MATTKPTSIPATKSLAPNFKAIPAVPSANALVDAALADATSNSDGETPIQVGEVDAEPEPEPELEPEAEETGLQHVRVMCANKVKAIGQALDSKLGGILESFPDPETMHPFYGDLMNVLYSREHYKMALATLRQAREQTQSLQKDYCRMLEFGA